MRKKRKIRHCGSSEHRKAIRRMKREARTYRWPLKMYMCAEHELGNVHASRWIDGKRLRVECLQGRLHAVQFPETADV